jgi:hypothetical protein
MYTYDVGLFLPGCPDDLTYERLGQIGKSGPFSGLDKGLDRHADDGGKFVEPQSLVGRHQLEVSVEVFCYGHRSGLSVAI